MSAKSILQLEHCRADSNTYRTIFKTKHGRIVFLALSREEDMFIIRDCFYIDRNRGRTGEDRCSARPKKLKTVHLPTADLLAVIGNELDKQFYGIEYTSAAKETESTETYIRHWERNINKKYRFLIMAGSGEIYNGLPTVLTTRLKNTLHRAIYVKLEYYKEGMGVVRQCYYYDRKYKQQERQVTPPMLLSCFFPYTKEGILDLLNHEICCDFTHMMIADDLDPDSDYTPLCGSI